MNTIPCTQKPTRFAARRAAAVATLLAASLALGGCAIRGGVGIGVPIVPGLALSLGYGPGGPVIGLATGWGPLGAGIGINQRGQVTGSAGVGVGVGVASGAAVGGVGVGVGKSVTLYEPTTPPQDAIVVGNPPPGTPGNPVAP
jgi:hypothetical protein